MTKSEQPFEAMRELVFSSSEPFTLGVELELQVVDLCDFDLGASASQMIAYLEKQSVPATISPELTESMIEISVGICTSWTELRRQLRIVRDRLVAGAEYLNVGICGGGAHPFQRWQQRRIFDNPRFHKVSSLYGYLAKQFTVFGQHIHVGCENGDVAMRFLHALNRFIPHFIALSASSPFFQGSVTSFHSSRLNSISAFPLSGRCPFQLTWSDFERSYYWPMVETGIVQSMKDFYWDIRPKPEYGTIELRICDTPLTVDRASLLAGYLQALCRRFNEVGILPRESEYLVYSFNRFQACRFGLDGLYIDPVTLREQSIRESVLDTIEWIDASKENLFDSDFLLGELREAVNRPTHADELMQQFECEGTMEDVVQFSLQTFKSNDLE